LAIFVAQSINMEKLVIFISTIFFGMFAQAQVFNHSEAGNRVSTISNKQQYNHFLHGVASGDPTQSGVILWTRISNHGDDTVEVNYTIATDVELNDIVKIGAANTSSAKDFTLKIDADGLEPATTYYYQFEYNGEFSRIGRTRTANQSDEHLRFGVVSCSNYQAGYFNVYRLLSTHSDLDAVIHLGDYIYEYEEGAYGWDSLIMRGHDPNHEILTLIDYRTRYSFYRLDEDLQAVHQQHPFIMIWDDHETANDSYKDGAQNHDANEGSWEARKAAAKQAWFEWLPVRDYPNQKIYRSLDYGNLMNLTMLDTRLEGRMPQIETSLDTTLNDPARTLLGNTQLEWFKNELNNNNSTWHIIGNQVIFAQVQLGALSAVDPRADALFYDTWNGYPAERDAIIKHIEDNELDNIVILTGDFHTTFGFDVAANPSDTLQYNPTNGFGSVCVEMAVPSVTSPNFDENVPTLVAGINNILPSVNPHLKKLDIVAHGYSILDIKPDVAQVDWFFTDTLRIPSNNEIYGGSLKVSAGENYWLSTENASTPKSESPGLAPPLITSIDELESINMVSMLGVYPNPADGFSILNLQVVTASELDLQLIDLNGKIVQEIGSDKMNPGFYSVNINTANLSNGVYFIRTVVENSVRTSKLVVKH